MKKNRMIAVVLVLILAVSILAGCGAKSQATMEYAMYADNAMAAEAPAAMKEEASMDRGALAAGGNDGIAQIPQNRKWIITVHLNAETDDLDALTAALNEKIAQLGGYVEDQNIYNGSTYSSSRRYRSANWTVRIPAADVDRFTQDVSAVANVVSNSKSLQDITLSYTTTENRLKALTTEETRLLELLAKAENMSDLLEIESRLTEVRYELENYGSQLKLYDNQVDYATIYLSISEVQEYTPVEEPTFLERITKGFTSSLKGVSEGAVDVVVFLVANLPYLVVYGLILFAAVKLLVRYRRSKPAREAKRLHREEMKLQKKQEKLKKKQKSLGDNTENTE